MAKFDIDAAKAAGYSDDEINAFLTKHKDLQPQSKSLLRKTGEFLAESPALPVAGAVIGAPVGGPLGSGLGGAAGEAYKQLLARGMGLEAPKTSLEAALPIAGTGLASAAGEAILGPLTSKVAGVGKTLLAPSKEEARMGIQAAEKAAGIGLKNIPENLPASADEVSQFANKVYRITSKGADRLARKVDPNTLQTIRKSIGLVLDRGVPDETVKNFLSSSKEVIERALDTAVPGYQEARAAFKGALEKEALLDNLAGAVKKGAKVAGAGAAGALGFTGLKRLIGGR